MKAIKNTQTGKYLTQYGFNKWDAGEDCNPDKGWTNDPKSAARLSDTEAESFPADPPLAVVDL